MNIYDITNKFIENTISIFNCIMLIMFISKYKLEISVNKLYYLLGFYILMAIFSLSNNFISLLMVNVILIILLLYSLFDGHPVKKITIIILAMLLDAFFEGFNQGIMNILSIKGEFTAQIITFLLICIVSCVVNKMSHRSLSNYIDDRLSYIYINLLLGLFSGIFPLIIVSMYGHSLDIKLNITILIMSFFMICTITLSTIFYMKKIKENSIFKEEIMLREQLSKAENKYFENIVDEYKTLRSFRHDINGHMNILYNLANEGSCDGVMEYLDNLREGVKTNVLHQCNNVYIAASINQYINQMQENAITFDFTYDVLDKVNMNSVDICSLFHNLMANAVEASIKSQHNRRITLIIEKIDCTLFVELKNTVHTNFNIKELERGSTTKENKMKHGIGLTNIDNVIHRYKGKIDYNLLDDTLIMNIVMLNIFN